MKLLFDANISWRVIKQLENDFPNCLHSSAIPVIQPAKDIDIWYFAKQNQFTIVNVLVLSKRFPLRLTPLILHT